MPTAAQLAKIAILRKQAKGLLEYYPDVEKLAKDVAEGRLPVEQGPKRFRKFIPGAAGAAGLTALQVGEPEEAEAKGPEAIWKKVAKALKGEVIEQHFPGQGARWGIVKLPEVGGEPGYTKFLRIKPSLGVQEVLPMPSGQWRAQGKPILSVHDMMKMISRQTPNEKDVEKVAKKYLNARESSMTFANEEQFAKEIARHHGFDWEFPSYYRSGVSEPGRQELTKRVVDRLLSTGGVLEQEGGGYIHKGLKQALKKITPEQIERTAKEELLSYPEGLPREWLGSSIARKVLPGRYAYKAEKVPNMESALSDLVSRGELTSRVVEGQARIFHPRREEEIARKLVEHPITNEEVEALINRLRDNRRNSVLWALRNAPERVPEMAQEQGLDRLIPGNEPSWRRQAFSQRLRQELEQRGYVTRGPQEGFTYTERFIPELGDVGATLEEIKTKHLALQTKKYSELPLAAEPKEDEFSRVVKLARMKGSLTPNELRNVAPAFYAKYPDALKQLYSKSKVATVEDFEQLAKELPLTGRYRVSVAENKSPAYGIGEYTATSAPRTFYRVAIHPGEKEEIEKIFPKLFEMMHSEPMTTKEVPTVGWLKVIKDLPNDTWYIEEVQSDVLAKARNKFLKEGKATPEQVLALEKSLKDWADYGLASVLRDARAENFGTVKVIGKDAVQELWTGHLGEKKATQYYRDMPKRFGFKLEGEEYEPSFPVSKQLKGKFQVSSRIPALVFTTLGAGALASQLGEEEAEARPLRIPSKPPRAKQEEYVDVPIPPGGEEKAKARLSELMIRGNLSESDALKQLKWELYPESRDIGTTTKRPVSGGAEVLEAQKRGFQPPISLTGQASGELRGLQPPISLTGKTPTQPFGKELRGLQPPIGLTGEASAQSFGGETRGLQPPIQLGGGPLAQAPEGLPLQPPVEGAEPSVQVEQPIQLDPGLTDLARTVEPNVQPVGFPRDFSLGISPPPAPIDVRTGRPAESGSGIISPHEQFAAQEVGLREEHRGLLRRGAEMFFGEGPVYAVTHPVQTAILAAGGYTRPLEELGREASKQALSFASAAVVSAAFAPSAAIYGLSLLPKLPFKGPTTAALLASTELAAKTAAKFFPKLTRRVVTSLAFGAPFAMTAAMEEEGEEGPKSFKKAVLSPVTTVAEFAPMLLEMGAQKLGTSLIGSPVDFIFDPLRKKMQEEEETPNIISTSGGHEANPLRAVEQSAWFAAFPVVGGVLAKLGGFNKVIGSVNRRVYKATAWPLAPIKPYWAKVADLAWESHSIPTIAGIGAAGATVGALTSEDPLEGALKGAGLALGGKALVESGHIPNPLAKKLTQVVQGSKGLTTERTFKTLGETFQPAIERLRGGDVKAKQVAASFRNARVQETFFRNIASKINEFSKELLPSETIEVMRGLSGTPLSTLKSSAARNAVQSIDSTINRMGLRSLYEDAARKQLGELIASPLEQASQTLPLSTIMSYVKQFEKQRGLVSGQVNQGAVHNLLDSIIRHPTVNPDMKHLAVGIYDIMAATPEAAAKAAAHGMETYLLDKLMANPGVVSKTMKLGYVESKHPSIKGMFVSRDLELELESMTKIQQLASDTYQKYFLNPWKMNKTILRPAAHFRNMYSNIILNDWGGLPFWRGDIYAGAASQLFKKGPLAKEFWNLAGETRFTMAETFNPFRYARYEDKPWNMAYRVYESMASPAKTAYAWEEQWAKLSKYMHNRELGMGKAEAAADAVKWTFNYQEVTPAIARLRTAWWGSPFATWTSKAIPLTVETAVKHPLRFGKWLALGYHLNSYALNQIGMSEEEWKGMKKAMPDYVSKSLMLMLPYRGNEGELKMLNLTWMIPGIGDLVEIKQKAEESPGSLATLAFQNPVGNILAAWKLNQKFGGAPIWHDWESYPTQAAKMLNYTWQQWSPAVLPGGTDWKAMYDSLTDMPEAPSPEEALAGQFGFRVITVSPEAAYKRKSALDKIYRAEIMQDMRRQLRFATTPEEQEEIISGAQENMMRLTGEEED
jgi:hypothetical protein